MIIKWYAELEKKCKDIKCHEHIVMHNHFHCIFENIGAERMLGANGIIGAHPTVAADLCVRPAATRAQPDNPGERNTDGTRQNPGERTGMGRHTGKPLRNPILGEHTGSPLRKIYNGLKQGRPINISAT